MQIYFLLYNDMHIYGVKQLLRWGEKKNFRKRHDCVHQELTGCSLLLVDDVMWMTGWSCPSASKQQSEKGHFVSRIQGQIIHFKIMTLWPAIINNRAIFSHLMNEWICSWTETCARWNISGFLTIHCSRFIKKMQSNILYCTWKKMYSNWNAHI